MLYNVNSMLKSAASILSCSSSCSRNDSVEPGATKEKYEVDDLFDTSKRMRRKHEKQKVAGI